MRPSPDELLAGLRLSLNETLLPKVEDRWARYVGAAMDLVIEHLRLRLAGERSVLDEDSADMAAVLASVIGRAAALGAGSGDSGHPRWGELAELLSPAARPAEYDTPRDDLAAATARNERLRGSVVAAMHWLDEAEARGGGPDVEELRDELLRLTRRQVDRVTGLVEPLFMTFGPVAK
jgi:hypothetical protein